MYRSISNGVPTANLAINKSRMKIYNKSSLAPTYYLQKGQEFQIELFNPTTDTVLAKIQLNGKLITQGGLVLRPGERVFLERYIDVPNKFKFDTYEVANSAEVKKAIEDNGDFKVEFYKERTPIDYRPILTINNPWDNNSIFRGISTGTGGWGGSSITTTANSYLSNTNDASQGISSITSSLSNTSFKSSSNEATMDSLSYDIKKDKPYTRRLAASSLKKESIETGRVEAGSHSNQKFEHVSKSFEFSPFHTIIYKLLPLSQKVNTTEDITVRLYCTNCGEKQKQEYKFCPKCGNKH